MTTLTAKKLPARPRQRLARIELPPLPDWMTAKTVRYMAVDIVLAAERAGGRADLRPLKRLLWELLERADVRRLMHYQDSDRFIIDDDAVILAHMAARALDTMALFRR